MNTADQVVVKVVVKLVPEVGFEPTRASTHRFLSSYSPVFQGFHTIANVHFLGMSQASIKSAWTLMISPWILAHFEPTGGQSGGQIFGGLGWCCAVLGWVSGGRCVVFGD